jgi:hypothetical protein
MPTSIVRGYTPSTFHPVFDQYVAEYRKAQDKNIADFRVHGTPEQLYAAQVAAMVNRRSLARCEFAILYESAIAMLDDIVHFPERYAIPDARSHFKPPSFPLWIEIDDIQVPPFYEALGIKVRGLFLDNAYTEDKRQEAEKIVPRSQHHVIENVFANLRGIHYLDLVRADGQVLFGFAYLAKTQEWLIPSWHDCPYGDCIQMEGEPARRCQCCKDALSLFSFWLPVAWVSFQGVFREEDAEVLVQRTTRREKKASNPKKKRSVTEERHFHVVRTIDISVKPPKADRDEGEGATRETGESSRGSWVERAKAIDPDLVKHDVRKIPERERTLSLPRYAKYIQEHGTNKVKVKAHTKSFPMLNDSNRVTRVKAKRYDRKPKTAS